MRESSAVKRKRDGKSYILQPIEKIKK